MDGAGDAAKLGALDAGIFPLAAAAAAAIESGFEGVDPEPAPHPLLAKTFSYRGMGGDFAGGSAVEGNMRFGGQLAAHSVTRWDRKVFRELLDTPLAEFLPAGAALAQVPALSLALGSKLRKLRERAPKPEVAAAQGQRGDLGLA